MEFPVPSIGGRYHIIPQLAYITYHLLREPETAIDTHPKELPEQTSRPLDPEKNFSPLAYLFPKKKPGSYFRNAAHMWFVATKTKVLVDGCLN